MEFFGRSRCSLSVARLRDAVTIDRLPELCASVSKVLHAGEEAGEIYSVWGQFRITRQDVSGGLRFTLPDCANGIQWTITTGFAPVPDATVVHCTINRAEQDPDFIESLQEFVDDWVAGLERLDA